MHFEIRDGTVLAIVKYITMHSLGVLQRFVEVEKDKQEIISSWLEPNFLSSNPATTMYEHCMTSGQLLSIFALHSLQDVKGL